MNIGQYGNIWVICTYFLPCFDNLIYFDDKYIFGPEKKLGRNIRNTGKVRESFERKKWEPCCIVTYVVTSEWVLL